MARTPQAAASRALRTRSPAQPGGSVAPRAPSFWLDQIGERAPRPRLEGEHEADVCIVGGGFTGLWTAYELRRADPGLKVVVLEAEYVGFGASGRNGGWVSGDVSGSVDAWRRRGGEDAPRVMAQAMRATVGEIGEVLEREAIQCDWHHGGTLAVAQNEPQLARLRAAFETQRAGFGDTDSTLLDAAALEQRIVVRGALGGVFNPHCARVQPAKLVGGLAHAVERMGGTIHEATPAHDVAPGLVRTGAGEVKARNVILATEGYTVNLPGRHRALLPLNSAMIVTEPLDDTLWEQLGWRDAETLHEGAYLYTYSQRTADGRIAIGGRGVPYRFGSRTDREQPVPARTVRELRARLAGLFPPVSEVPLAGAWHGVLGVPRDWCPTVAFDARSGMGSAGGYVGQGVAAANLAGRTLRDLILGRDTPLARLPWVGPPPRRWEPEPLRFIGARGVYALYGYADRREARTGRPSRIAALADLVAGR